ncbi:MAG: DOMON-like domain-containing protein [Thermodesulfobacteriota bacterium]
MENQTKGDVTLFKAGPRVFTLRPFEPAQTISWLVDGTISRRRDALHLFYRVTGPLEQLVLAEPGRPPQRRDNLWQESCFEVFVGAAGGPGYWEVNLAPSGDWNVYRFTGYRQGMRPAERVGAASCRISRQEGELVLEADLDIAGLEAPGPLRAGVSTVLLFLTGEYSYWSLAHPAARPDFHDPRGFLLRL